MIISKEKEGNDTFFGRIYELNKVILVEDERLMKASCNEDTLFFAAASAFALSLPSVISPSQVFKTKILQYFPISLSAQIYYVI